MEKNLRVGLFFSFLVSGVIAVVLGVSSMSDDSLYMGIGLLVLDFIWGMLFVLAGSPIRRMCWSVSDRVQTIVWRGSGGKQYLTVDVTWTVSLPIEVEKVELSVGKKKMVPFDWKSRKVEGYWRQYVNFERPNWLCNGRHSAKLKSYTNYGYSKSEVFELEVRN